jgi:hypothetical protein
MNNTIIKYIHDPRNNTRVGVIAATKLTNDPSKVGIGWSFAAIKKGDKFDREMGKKIALNRANTGTSLKVQIPRIMVPEILDMRTRAVRYFKTSEVVD